MTDVCVNLANKGIRVIVAGLDMDFKAQPFGPIPNIMAIAEHVTKVHAVCMQCGAPANYSLELHQIQRQSFWARKKLMKQDAEDVIII